MDPARAICTRSLLIPNTRLAINLKTKKWIADEDDCHTICVGLLNRTFIVPAIALTVCGFPHVKSLHLGHFTAAAQLVHTTCLVLATRLPTHAIVTTICGFPYIKCLHLGHFTTSSSALCTQQNDVLRKSPASGSAIRLSRSNSEVRRIEEQLDHQIDS